MYFKPARRRRMGTRTIIIIAAAAAAGAFALLYFLGIIPSFKFTSNVQALDFALPETVSANKNGILYNQNNTLHLIDAEGKEHWSLNLELSDASTATSEELIVNYVGKTVQAMRYSKEQLFKTSLDSNIVKAAAGKNTVAVQTTAQSDTDGTLRYLHLFNISGERIGQIDSLSDKQIIDFGFYGESDMFWVLALDVSGVVPASEIITFKPDGSPTTTILISSEIVERVFVTDSTIFASGTNTLSSFTYFSTKQAEQPVFGWKAAASSAQPAAVKLAFIPRTKSTEIDAARVYSADLSMVHIRLPRNVFSVAVTQNRLYAFSAETVYIYTMDGTLEKQLSLDAPITRAQQLSDTTAVLWDNQKSYIMSLS